MHRPAILLYDLVARDGRRVIEVRVASDVGTGLYTSAKSTVYSIAYSTDLGRRAAFVRAVDFCSDNEFDPVFRDADGLKAAWQ